MSTGTGTGGPPDRARWITVEGARTNNLRGITVRIPKHQITVCTGVSGSGKSSLAFGTIAAEAQRLVADSYPLFVRNRLPQHGHAEADRIDGLVFTTVVDQRPFTGNARSTVGTASDLAPLLRMLFSRIGAPHAGYSPAYSFNDPSGMCPQCEGLGSVDTVNVAALLDTTRSLAEGAILFPTFAPGTYRWKRLVFSGLFDPERALATYSEAELHTLLYAENLPLVDPHPEYPKSARFDGVIPRLRASYLRKLPSRLTAQEQTALARVVSRGICPACDGARVNAAARASLIAGRSIADWSALPITALRELAAELHDARVDPVVTAIRERLAALDEVGLGYLSLDRLSTTLSGGEAQRVKLVRHLGSALSDACFIFDEPSVGMHPHDVQRLLTLLAQLRDAHNTVLVVEHHPTVIAAADHVIDLGPGSGRDGGLVQFSGPPALLAATDTPTSRILREPIRVQQSPRSATRFATVTDATAHNLRAVTVNVPLGVLTAVTGVAGSGKSSLATRELPGQHPDFAVMSQRPLRGSSRSTSATVLGIAEAIRHSFGAANDMAPSWFSANGRGACRACGGKGITVTDLAFLEDVRSVCEACDGSRFNPTALAASLDGVTIAQALAMTPGDAANLFEADAECARRLHWLDDVGLGYIAIGQSVDTLSGGERQRLLLAKHLADAPDPARLRIVLDEPTAGLHGSDTDRLLRLCDRLVDAGATIVVVEHNMRVIAHVDHVIDMGPGAGSDGGTVVYAGPPAGLLSAPGSLTGRYLARFVG